ncbi:MAG: DNA polymerase III subunit delta' [Sphingomonadales bacterium]
MSDAGNDFSPRTTPFLVGHAAAADIFLKSFQSGRLHHAWLLAGPKGIGKATLAYHLARFLLKHGAGGLVGDTAIGADALAMAADDPVFSHVASGADGNLKVIERGLNEKTKRLRQEIVVADVRNLHDFFEKTAARDGWRIAIIDSADEMNRNAANALLKMLEEPPSKSILFLVSHAKGRLVPTIRSRCHQLLLNPLTREQVSEVLVKQMADLDPDALNTLAAVSGGAPGFALRLAANDGLSLCQTIQGLVAGTTMITKQKHDFAGAFGARGADERYFLLLEIVRSELARRIRQHADQPSHKSQLDCWLGLWEKVNRMQREGEGLNLGRRQQVLLLLEALESTNKNAAAA